MSIVASILAPLTSIISEPLKEWQKRKTIRTEAKLKVEEINAQATVMRAEADVALAKQGQRAENDLDRIAVESMKGSWKDEFLLIVLYGPLIVSFAPAYIGLFEWNVEAATRGLEASWANVGIIPDWYIAVLLVTHAAIFGTRRLIRPLVSLFSKGK